MSAARRARTPREKRPIFYFLAAIVLPPFSLIMKLRFRGAENLPATGAYVLAPNHHSEFDPLVVAVGVWRGGRAPRFLAKESLFRVPVLGAILRGMGMVPVQRHTSASASRVTVTAAETLVRNGQGVIVYPEGTLTRDPDLWPMRGKTGAVRLALAGGIPLVPVAQWGAQQIMPRYGRFRLWPLRRPATMIIGEPIDLSDLAGRGSENAALTEGTRRLMDAIAGLLGELREETPPVERWDPARHAQSESGRYES